MLAEFVKIKRPLTEYTDISGQEKAFDFIMHDPLLKQAIGDVTLRVFVRDKRINHKVAIQKVKKVLTEVRGNFLAVFLLELMELTLPQILQIMEKHSIDAKELLRMGGPIIMSILPATHTEKNLFLKMEIKEENEYKISLGFDGYDPYKKNPPDKMFG